MGVLYYVALALACLLIGYRVGVGIERARGVLERAEHLDDAEPTESARARRAGAHGSSSREKPSWLRRTKP